MKQKISPLIRLLLGKALSSLHINKPLAHTRTLCEKWHNFAPRGTNLFCKRILLNLFLAKASHLSLVLYTLNCQNLNAPQLNLIIIISNKFIKFLLKIYGICLRALIFAPICCVCVEASFNSKKFLSQLNHVFFCNI